MGLLKDFKEFAMRGRRRFFQNHLITGRQHHYAATGSPHGRGGFFQPVY